MQEYFYRHRAVQLDVGSRSEPILLASLLFSPARSELRLVESEGTGCENLPKRHAIVRRLRKEIDTDYSSRVLVAEANQWPADVRPYFADGDEFHMAFHFPLMPRIYMALARKTACP